MRRLLTAALGSAAMALFLLLVSPFPSDVLGQTAPTPSAAQEATVNPGGTTTLTSGATTVTLTNAGPQPVIATLQGTSLTLAAPAGYIVVVNTTTAMRPTDLRYGVAEAVSAPLQQRSLACTPVGQQLVDANGNPGSNVVTCTVRSGMSLSVITVAGVSRTPGAPAAPAAPARPAAPAPVQPRPAAAPPAAAAQPTQRPAALPRTGVGSAFDSSVTTSELAAYALLALAAALISSALVLNVRRVRR